MKQSKNLPTIGITMGDPVGIGPEIVIKALNIQELYTICKPVIIGDSSVLKQALTLLNLNDMVINSIDDPKQGKFLLNTLDVMNVSNITTNYLYERKNSEAHISGCDNKSGLPHGNSRLLRPDIKTGTAMLNYLVKGIDLALKNKIHALVTCPITKTALKLAGSKFPGHTEILAHKTNTKNYAMMLAGEKLKVVLVTLHIPLSKVCGTLTTEDIIQKIELTHTSLKERFDIKSPRLAVAGLNPHAGEALMFGSEEEKIIAPAVKFANQNGLNVEGPLPPDTVFYQAVHGNRDGHVTNQGKYDAVICMYHDQGLIPFKLIHFKDGVNTTLGLPIIRTSVDHGTAYDIAWKGIADPSSLVQAIKMAIFQADNCHGI